MNHDSTAFIPALFDLLPQGLIWLDAEGNLVRSNPHAERLCAPSLSAWLEAHRIALISQPPDSETEITDEAGRCLRIRIRPLDREVHGGDGRLVFVQEDPRLDAAREQSRRLLDRLTKMRKMEGVGRLASALRHEFNNIFTGSNGNLSLALLDLPPTDPLYETLTEIIRLNVHAFALTQKLSSYSGKYVDPSPSFHLDQTILGLEKVFKRMLNEKTQIRLDLRSGDTHVSGDPVLFEQGVVALMENSLDAIAGEGEICLATEMRANAEGRQAAVRIQDNGAGMTPETLRQAGQPFFTTKDPEQHMGLGLHTARSMFESVGGRMVLASEIGKGTTVRIELLRLLDEGASPYDMKLDGLPTGTETLVVVESDSSARDALLKVLKRLGYRTLFFSQPGDAYLALEENPRPVDLLLATVNGANLPTVRKLFQRLKRHSTQIKALHVLDGSLPDPPLPCLFKPYTTSMLAREIRKALDL